MQALINCQLIVSHAFADAVARAAAPVTDDNGVHTSPLEQNFEEHWPDATKFVPSGPDGVDEAFAPDERRREIFEGYTFIFYDKRYETMFPIITAGKGKALLRKVVPRQTDVDDFIRYVKSVAGEKGLGEFEDGSEGKGVVVVRYTPAGEEEEWYKDFFNEFALRLDHRPIEMRDIFIAVLDFDPAQLRRPLLLELTQRESGKPINNRSSVDLLIPLRCRHARPRTVCSCCRPRYFHGGRRSSPEPSHRAVTFTASSSSGSESPSTTCSSPEQI